MLLQQKYRDKGFKKYSKLSSHRLVAEQNNNLSVKTHKLQLTGSTSFPKVNKVYAHHARCVKGHESSCGCGRGRGPDYDQERKHVLGFSHSSNKWFCQKEQGKNKEREAGKACVCFRCGAKEHYARDCHTPKHLVELYQASLKEKKKNSETNVISENHVDVPHLDESDFFEHLEKNRDHLIGDGSVAMKE
ncbi:uncharacterized protein LOC107865056 [Capsicum annuum]|uniref:uncharacterized protein LOC107865056 n=1 Tax=Capsicum annuum TaxID=4072 RepID=UPI0007BEB9E1|nr:uncharacterized protein LOC107865056 [Capsicum annuum]